MPIEQLFRERFGEPRARLRVFRAAGRINLIGEHTDYSLGFVLPAAIQLGITGAFEPAAGGGVQLWSRQLGALSGEWGRRVSCIANVLGDRVTGVRGVIDGDLPVGSGLASSAALELLLLEAISRLSGRSLDRTELARLGQQAEWAYGVKCGLLDQLAIAHGKKNEVSLIDMRSLERRPVAIDLKGHRFVIAFTKERVLGDEYNQRTRECAAAAAALGVPTLRDVTPAMLEQARLDPVLARRARHVVHENRRVLEAVAALERSDVARFGALLYETHVSLRDLFEVSCPELDAMVESARACGVAGRMMGGGFGGPALLLVPGDRVADAKVEIEQRYFGKTGLYGRYWDVSIEDGLVEVT